MYKPKLGAQTINRIGIIGVFLFFFILYFSLSLLLAQTGAFSNYGIFFELDTPRIVGDMAIFDANHYRTNVHPLFVLLVNPTGTLLSHLLKSPLLAAMVLNSFLGAAGVLLAFFYFKSLTENIYSAGVLAFLFGITTSQLFLSAIPETAVLSICSLLATYIVFIFSVKYKRDDFLLWVLAGVFTLAVTTTNFVQTLICFAAFSFMRSNLKKQPLYALAKVFAFLLCVIACVVFLAKIQKMIYPSSSLFYMVEAYQEDILYTSPLIFQTPLIVISQLLKHSFLVNIVTPFPDIYSIIGQDKPALTISHSLDFTFAGWAAIVLWLALFITSVFQVAAKKQEIPLFIGFTFAVCLLFNFGLHSIYGIGVSGEFEYFPYTGNFSFLTLSALAYLPFQSKNIYRVLLGALTLLAGMNNIIIFARIISIYQ